MNLILLPTLITSTHLLVEILTKKKHAALHYVRVFTICLGWNIFFDSYLQASECEDYYERNAFFYDCSVEISDLRKSRFIDYMALRPAQQKEYRDKMQHHLKEGQRCFREAETMCTLIPNETDKNTAIYLFSQALVISLNNCNFAAVVITLEANLIAYGLYQWNQWNKMQTLLLESKHHFEMSDFYKDILEKA